jgi:hypothetical protein
LLAVKAHLQALKEHQEMSALFPTFLSLGKRIIPIPQDWATDGIK